MLHARGANTAADAVAGITAVLLLVVAIAFGGGVRGAGDLVVHLAAIPALGLGLVRWRHRDATRVQRWFLYWLLAVIALFALHLLPLPAGLIARLPQRADVLADLQSAGVARPWLPMTLDLWGALRGLLAVLSFGAMWLLASTLPYATRVRLLQLAVVVAVLMSLVGFAQAAAGQQSQMRAFDYHHPIGAIGTFANRNHFASLLAMLAPCALVFAMRAQSARKPSSFAWYGAAVLLVLASALSFSRAGFALTLMAMVVSAVVLLWRKPGKRGRVVPAVVAMLAVLAVGYYAWDGLMQRVALDPLADLRWQYLQYGWQTVMQYLPWGSGLGSFQHAYAPLEPVSAMTSSFAQRAHNEPLQVLIEAGVPGAMLLAAFVALLFVRDARKIRMASTGAMPDAFPATVLLVAIFVPMLHSLVDYPMRTLGAATVFALLLTLLHGVKPGGERDRSGSNDV